jgi:hypothetical protein
VAVEKDEFIKDEFWLSWISATFWIRSLNWAIKTSWDWLSINKGRYNASSKSEEFLNDSSCFKLFKIIGRKVKNRSAALDLAGRLTKLIIQHIGVIRHLNIIF